MRDEHLAALKARYTTALRDYLGDPGEPALHHAYELGRRAIGDGLGVIDVIALHQEAQDKVLKSLHGPEVWGGGFVARDQVTRPDVGMFDVSRSKALQDIQIL